MKRSKLFRCTVVVIFVIAVIIAIKGFNYHGGESKDNLKSHENMLEDVTLKMYLIGEKPKDFDIVYEKVNEKMKEKINTELDVEFLPWANMDEEYSLLFQCGEQFDLIFTAENWAHYIEISGKNGFYELTEEMIEKYAPNIYNHEPKEAWNQAKVNGKIYMIPSDQIEYGSMVFGIRGDLKSKYGIDEIKNYDDLEKYMDAAADDSESGVEVISNGGGQNLQFPYMIDKNEFQDIKGVPLPTIGFDINDTSGKIFTFVDTDEYIEYAHKMKEFANKGYWSKDSLLIKVDRDEDFMKGNSAVMAWNVGSVSDRVERLNKTNPEWKAEIVDVTKGIKRTIMPYTNNGMAINAKSKNPERALMALDLLRYDKDIYDLTWYGIENVHWESGSSNEYAKLDDNDRFPAGNVCPWGWYSQKVHRTPANQFNASKDIVDNWMENYTVDNPLTSFCFNDKNVKNQVAQVGKVIEQYGVPIDLGMCSDVDAAIQEYKGKLKEAGLYEIYEECENQVQEYLKENYSIR